MKRFLSVLFILSFIGFCEAQAQPDLTFVGTTPLVSTQAGKIIIDLLSVINIGSSSTNECKGNILVDGALKDAFLIPSLAAPSFPSTAASQKDFNFTIQSVPGPHTVEIRLDVNNQNNESNEGNNTRSRSVTVPPPPPPPPVTITVTKSGSGTGTVTGSGGIDCGANCSSSVSAGTTITLKALASSNSAFKGWSNGTGSAAACNNSTSAICRFTLSQNSVIRANFDVTVPPLTPPPPSTKAGPAPVQ